jgi:sigma-E factor negative regulatory protein RseB
MREYMKYLHNVSVIWSYIAMKNIVFTVTAASALLLTSVQFGAPAAAQSAPNSALANVAANAATAATTPAPAMATSAATLPDSAVKEWLRSMHEAAMRKRSYIGTVVVSSQQGISSAKIWHACDGVQQMERIESLTGAPRSSFRKGDQMLTFHPDTKTARAEKRDALGAFPGLLKPGANQIPEFYAVKAQGAERMAGLDADVVQLLPKDPLRFGYRVWTDKKSQLVLKLQTLDASGAVLEQAAFTEVQLDAPVKMEKLAQKMAATEGYKIETVEMTKTTAAAEGWLLKSAVPGFKPMSCFKRAKFDNAAASASPTMQWIFSDGLATVSLFVEDFDKTRHLHEGAASSGATHTLLRRMDAYWLTAVGEVPAATLKQFAAALERKK